MLTKLFQLVFRYTFDRNELFAREQISVEQIRPISRDIGHHYSFQHKDKSLWKIHVTVIRFDFDEDLTHTYFITRCISSKYRCKRIDGAV